MSEYTYKAKYRVTLTDLYDHVRYLEVETDMEIEEFIKEHIFCYDIVSADWTQLTTLEDKRE